MKKLLPLLVAAFSCHAADQALVCGGSTWGATGTIPNSAPFTSIGSYTISMRFVANSFTGTSSTMNVVTLGSGGVQYAGGVLYFGTLESEGANFQLTGSQIPSGDFEAVIERDTSAQTVMLYIWTGNTLSASYNLGYYSGTSVNLGGATVGVCGPGGYNGSTATIDFLRLDTSALPVAPAAPITGIHVPASGLSYEFTGTLADSSGNSGPTLMPSSSATYTSTIPTYNPYSYVASPLVFAAGASAANWSISGTSSFSWVGTGALTYSWTMGSCVNSPTLSGTTSNTLTVIGSTTVFGECDFNLQVTDESSNTGTATAQAGGIYVNSSGVVNLTSEANANVSQAMGPLIGFGYSPWPYTDAVNLTQANLYYPLLVNSAFAGTVPAITQAGSSGSTFYSYQVVAVGSGANVLAVTQPGNTTAGNATLNGTNYNIVPTPTLSGSSYCGVYRIVSKGSPSTTGWIGKVSCGSSLNDTGLSAGNDPWSSTTPTPNPYPDFETTLPGTISISGTTVTGTGTNFIRDLCAGGSSSTGQDVLVIWSTASTQPTSIPQLYPITPSWTCNSANSLTLGSAYSGPTPNGSYSIMRNYGAWIGGSTNFNYYDVVLAFFSTYFRTGLTQYLTAANNLADYWIKQPYVDYFRASGGNVLPARSKAVAGLVIRYLLSAPTGYLNALQNNAAYWVTGGTLPTTTWRKADGTFTTFPYDVRDLLGYPVWQVALAALYDTNSTNVANDVNWLNTTATTEAAIEADLTANWYSHGMWTFGGSSPSGQSEFGVPNCGTGINGYTGTVTVTNGSSTVTGSGTNWSSSACFGVQTGPETMLVAFDNDNAVYCPVYVSATSMTLKDPTCTNTVTYSGTSRSGAYWLITATNTTSSSFEGDGGPPTGIAVFMDGILMSAWYYAGLATGNSSYQSFQNSSASWLVNYGMRSSTGGVYYGRVSPWCEYGSGPDGRPSCGDDSSSGARFLAGEDLGGFGFATMQNSTFSSNLKLLYAQVYGKLGGPLSDGGYASELDSPSLGKWKDFGFAFGVGGAARIPAVLAGSGPASSRSVLGPGISIGSAIK